jgi:hypothetical protein
MKIKEASARIGPHRPSTFLGGSGPMDSTHRPIGLYKKPRPMCTHVPLPRRGCTQKQRTKPGRWIDLIPPAFVLPDLTTLERLSRGEAEPTQGQLFDTQADGLAELRRKVRGIVCM